MDHADHRIDRHSADGADVLVDTGDRVIAKRSRGHRDAHVARHAPSIGAEPVDYLVRPARGRDDRVRSRLARPRAKYRLGKCRREPRGEPGRAGRKFLLGDPETAEVVVIDAVVGGGGHGKSDAPMAEGVQLLHEMAHVAELMVHHHVQLGTGKRVPERDGGKPIPREGELAVRHGQRRDDEPAHAAGL